MSNSDQPQEEEQTIDTAPDTALDRITKLAAEIFEVSFVWLIAAEGQYLWARSCFEFSPIPERCQPDVPLDIVLSSQTIALEEIPEDAPVVRNIAEIRFYAGAPLRLDDGTIYGTLAIADRKPQSFDQRSRTILEGLAASVVTELNLRAARETLEIEREDGVERDPLTNLLSHLAFQKHLKEKVTGALRMGQSLAIILMDLDNFRLFNASYGHSVGDEVILQVANALADQSSHYGYKALARYGGDEFAFLVPNANRDDLARISHEIETILDGMGYRPGSSTTVIPYQASIGAAVLPDDGISSLDLLDVAHSRLARTKTGGGDETAEHLRMKLSRSVEGFSLLDALVTAVDNKDNYTRRHSEDVLTYSLAIAKEMGLDEQMQYQVQVAALLHDVGKIGIPDYILRKPGRLTEDEYQAVKQHPMMGAIMVSAIPGFEEVLDATRHHHERWDGGGYPFGLIGKETPLLARLMAVADAYSAMTTDRPYRKGLSPQEAQRRLLEGAGKQWDPECIHLFLRASRRLVA